VVEIRFQQVAVNPVDGVDKLRKVHLDAALLSQRLARRTARGPLHAPAANAGSNFRQVLREIGLRNCHDSLLVLDLLKPMSKNGTTPRGGIARGVVPGRRPSGFPLVGPSLEAKEGGSKRHAKSV
jgi:hypothetical protein